MAKQLRWQIPFISTIDNITYSIDIYDEEGDWSGITELQGGISPFITDEDDNTDYFSPVRIQTGIIQVCTKLSDGSMLNLKDIIPDNNISKPVKLTRYNNPSDDWGDQDTVWQGFLSCEVYNQDYIGTPQTLNLPVMSVLEAMDSVKVEVDRSIGVAKVNQVIYNALNEIAIQCGMKLFTHINYSFDSDDIFNKYIDQTVFYERKEYNNENDTWYIISGMSAKAVIERVCTFMGWVAREQGTELYLARINADFGMYRTTIEDFITLESASYIPNSIENLIELQWRGTGHQYSIAQGAKSVGVVAELDKYNLNISLPEFPVGSTTTVYRPLWRYKVNEEDKNYLYLLANRNIDAYSNIQYGFYSANVRYLYHYFEDYQTSSLTPTLTHIAVGINSSILSEIQGEPLNLVRFYAGAFLCRYCWEKDDTSVAHDTTDALYCTFFPGSIDGNNNFDISQVGPIFSINNVTHYTCHNGYLKLSAATDTIFKVSSQDYQGSELAHSSEEGQFWKIGIELQYGDKWWNGSSWQSSQAVFTPNMTLNNFQKNWNNSMEILETDGLLIPITEEMDGLITLKIWPIASFTYYGGDGVLEMIFSKLKLEHLVPENANETDRNANHYFRLLETNFRNEVSVSTSLASYLNNEASPSLIMSSPDIYAKTITYNRENGSTEQMRPELDLLNRLAKYYQKSRQALTVQVKHPSSAALALTQLNGINDGKVYTPIAESRDWKEDVSTITCMEIPNE